MAFSPALAKTLFLCFLIVNCLLGSHSNFAQIRSRSVRSGSDVRVFKREAVDGNGTIHSLLERVVTSESNDETDDNDCAPLSVPISEQCAHVKASCDVASSFLSIQYLEHYFCSSPTARPAIFTLFLLWLFFLFSTLGISASDFFCPNLSTIADILGLDENVAGVTLLAFGNGSPDVFSTFSAMRADAGSLAVGELIGAASFIVSCVAGSLCIIKPFHVHPRPFLRDAGFFTVAVAMLLIILWDGEIRAWEAGSLVGLYVVYVIAVALGTWWEKRRNRKTYLEAVARGEWDDDEISIPPTLVEEQYHDETPPPELTDSLAVPSPYVRTRAHSSPGAIPRLGIDTSAQVHSQYPFPHQHSSRSPSPTPSVHRHMHGSGHIGHMPSFSLIGALEFRDVVASLRNQSASTTLSMFESPATPYHSHSLHGSLVGRQSLSGTGRRRSHYSTRDREVTREGSHQRSISHGGSGAILRSGQESAGFEMDPWDAAGRDVHSVPLNERSPSMRSPVEQPRHLEPFHDEDEQSQPDSQPGIKLQVPTHSRDVSTTSAPPGISLQPSQDSNATSTTLPYISRTPASPTSPAHSQSDILSPSASASSFLGLSLETENAQRSSSYDPLQNVRPLNRKQKIWTSFTHTLRVLFPTLRDFREKSVMWMMASILAAPAVLMLTLTLPVHVVDKDVEREYEKVGLGGGVNSMNGSRGVGAGPAEGRLVDFEEEGVERVLTAEEEVEEEMHDVHFNKWLMAAQCALGPLFCVAVLFAGTKHEIWLLAAVAVGGLAAALLVAVFADKGTSPSARMARCFMGFFVAIVWIMAIADEVVNVLKTFGFIFGLSDAIIGLTIFAVGNSLADLIANISVAAFAPVMGFSACFGGPMLNILLGVGVSGSYIIQQASGEPYRLHFSKTLLVSTIGLLALLVCTLIFVPWNGFYLTRKWGLFLVVSYVVIMVINIAVEVHR